jgi:predicted ATP-grasp superfamily ATP-dependent carboligase
MMIENKQVAVVIGLNTNGLAVVRSLARNGVPVNILLAPEDIGTPYYATRYGEKIILPSLKWPDVCYYLYSLKKNAVIFPTIEHIVQKLSAHRENIPSHHCLLLPKHSVVQMLQDKALFDEFARHHSLKLPLSWVVRSLDDVETVIRQGRMPVIIKPVKKLQSPDLLKAYIVQKTKDLPETIAPILAVTESCIVQEFIPGDDKHIYFCMQYINSSGQLLASFTGRKIRQWQPLSGGTASCEPVFAPELHEITQAIFQKAGFWGIGSMEYKKDPRDDLFYIIEPTVGRTDFQEAVAIANDVNIPFIAYQDAIGNAVKPIIKNGGRKAWMHFTNDRLAAANAIERNQLTRLQWLYSLRKIRCFDFLSFSDPAPTFSFLKTVCKNRCTFLANWNNQQGLD